jgi:hypothetical protein
LTIKLNQGNELAMADCSPEKAGVGGSIPSLATTSKALPGSQNSS